MSVRTLTYTHEGKDYTGEYATIRSTMLGWEDHGILTAYLNCEWQSSGIGVGGFALDKHQATLSGSSRVGTAYGLDHLMHLMQTVGSNTWEGMAGKPVIILFDSEGGVARGIAHPIENKVFILKDHAEKWRDK